MKFITTVVVIVVVNMVVKIGAITMARRRKNGEGTWGKSYQMLKLIFLS